MASILTENAQAGDKAIFDDIIERAYPGYKKMTSNAILQKMLSDGVIQVDGLFEKAIAKVGKIERESTVGRDFADGSDAKKVTTYHHNKRPGQAVRAANVGKLKNKSGVLRVIVGESLTGKTYYFRIPPEKYVGKSSIRITFNVNGLPDGSSWFDYSVKTFEELCA